MAETFNLRNTSFHINIGSVVVLYPRGAESAQSLLQEAAVFEAFIKDWNESDLANSDKKPIAALVVTSVPS